MMVMPANNSNAHAWNEQFPNRFGLLMTPDGLRDPRDLPYAIENAMFGAWKASGFSVLKCEQREFWDGCRFLDAVAWACARQRPPLWILAPDVPGNADETRREFDEWAPHLEETGIPLAMAVQDGMTPADVPDGVVPFVGGTTEWKWRNFERFAKECSEPAHVGRVNSYRRLWQCHEAGVASTDGTGWFRGDQKQLSGLRSYLQESGEYDRRPRRQLVFSFRT